MSLKSLKRKELEISGKALLKVKWKKINKGTDSLPQTQIFYPAIALQPVGVELWYFKLTLFDINRINSLKQLRSTSLGCKNIGIWKSGCVVKTQFKDPTVFLQTVTAYAN